MHDFMLFAGIILLSGVGAWIAGVGLFTLLGLLVSIFSRLLDFLSMEVEYAWVRWRSRWRGLGGRD